MSKKTYSDGEYLRRYQLLSGIADLNFKPKRIRQTYKGELIREYFQISPAQKAKITRLSSEKNADGKRVNSHLYNVARNVADSNASFISIKKSKNQKKKLSAFKKSGLYTTNKGLVVFSPEIEKVKIQKRGTGYIVKYDVVPKRSTDKNVKRQATFRRSEIFIAIPLSIWRSEDLLAIFLADLEHEYDPESFRLAINGRQGKQAFRPSDIYKYIITDLSKNFVTATPYVTGVYLIYKQKNRSW